MMTNQMIFSESDQSFYRRHVGSNLNQIQDMLDFLGYKTLDDLLSHVIPSHIKSEDKLQLRPAVSERQALSELRQTAKRNKVMVSMLGQGYYGTITPNVILRNVLENPAWYTAYTAYQSEISQGRLEALLNFQQMIMDFTAMDVAGASLLDEATAGAEAMAMMARLDKKKTSMYFY